MKKEKNKVDNKIKEVVSDICLFCDAPCCKVNFVPLTDFEVKSGKYDMVKQTIFDFESKKIIKGYFLKRKKDGSCIYLNDFNLCSIWKDRPIACRKYACDKLKQS